MACRRGQLFLKASDREALLLTFAKYIKENESNSQDQKDHRVVQTEGCRVCSKDNDHSNMLICEKCNAEYHFYCIGLKAVPRDDWYCGKLALEFSCFACEHSCTLKRKIDFI